MKKILPILFLIVLIAGLGVTSYFLFVKKDKKEQTEVIKAEEKDDKKVDTKEASLPVKVMEIKRGDLPLRLPVTATADVWEKATIRTEASGRVDNINCRVGQLVEKGRLLVKIDDTEKKLDVDSRRALKLQTLSKFLVKEKTVTYENPELTPKQKKELEDSRIKYQQAIKDFEKGKITERQFDIIKNGYEELLVFSGSMREEVLKATENLTESIIGLKKSELELARASIRSPFPGIITELKVSKGEILSVGQEMLNIVNLNSLYLKGYALESEIGKLKKDIAVRIKFDAYPDQYFYGQLEAISPEVDEQKKTLLVYVKVDNPQNKIYPGMHAEIDIEYKVHEAVLKVPIEAVRFRSDRAVVFVIKDIKGKNGVADWRYVELGAKNDEEWEVVNGIQEGEMIVIEGHMTLAHQSKVRIED